MSSKRPQEYQGRFQASIPDNDYQMKSCIMVEIGQKTTSGWNHWDKIWGLAIVINYFFFPFLVTS
jgi:hypothetical protein